MTDNGTIVEAELNARLLPHADTLLQEWCGEIEHEGDEIVMRNPARQDHHLGSFKFNRKTGLWSDFADPDRFSGQGLVTLYAAVNGITTAEAKKQLSGAADQFGFRSGHQAEFTPPPDLDINAVDEEADEVPLPPDVHSELGVPAAMYRCMDSAGRTAMYIYRFENNEEKETRPLSWSDARKCWVWKYPRKPWPLYALGPAGGDIIVVEGEKTAEAAAKQFPNHRVVTSACGSGQSGKSDWLSLKNRNVFISPDNDGPGREYALKVAGHAVVVGAASVAVIDNTRLGWGDGDDLADRTVDDGYLNSAVAIEHYADASERERGVVEAAALLSIGDYDRAKRQLAESIDVGVRAFDALVKAARTESADANHEDAPDDQPPFGEVVPWDHPVNGQELFDEIIADLDRHVVLQPGQAAAVALWIMLSWVFERFKILPQLLLCSPVKRCGKTTLLELISYMAARPLAAANLTGAAVFRSVEMYRPTFLVDEADTFLNGNSSSELTGILNSGHNHATAFVIRVEEIDGERVPVRYSTFCPKVLAMIKTPADTLLDRSIVIEMQRKPVSRAVQSLGLNAEQSFHDLRRKLARWRDDIPDTFEHVLEACPLLPNDRARQNWSALLSVARLAGAAAYDKGLNAVRLLSDTSHLAVDQGADLLFDVRTVFRDERKDQLPSKVLLKKLNDMQDRPWIDQNRGRGLTGHGLAKELKPFGVRRRNFKDGARSTWGYALADLQPVFDKYLEGPNAE